LAIRHHNIIVYALMCILRSLELHVLMESTHDFTDIDPGDNKRLDFVITNPYGDGRQIIVDAASTGVHGQSQCQDDDPFNALSLNFLKKWRSMVT
jgi:hypothetical protein